MKMDVFFFEQVYSLTHTQPYTTTRSIPFFLVFKENLRVKMVAMLKEKEKK